MEIIAPAFRDILQVGGRIFTDLENLVELHGYVTNPNYTTLRKANASAGYQVPVGKVFEVHAVRISSYNAAGVAYQCYLSYGDNDVGLQSAAAPANIVYPTGNADNAGLGQMAQILEPGTSRHELSIRFNVPAQKYATARSSGTAGSNTRIVVFGYEVSA